MVWNCTGTLIPIKIHFRNQEEDPTPCDLCWTLLPKRKENEVKKKWPQSRNCLKVRCPGIFKATLGAKKTRRVSSDRRRFGSCVNCCCKSLIPRSVSRGSSPAAEPPPPLTPLCDSHLLDWGFCEWKRAMNDERQCEQYWINHNLLTKVNSTVVAALTAGDLPNNLD